MSDPRPCRTHRGTQDSPLPVHLHRQPAPPPRPWYRLEDAWQRGSNENTNRLLRFWLPKGGDLSEFSAADLDTIAAKLNARPRPTLGLRTPADCLNELFLDEQHVA